MVLQLSGAAAKWCCRVVAVHAVMLERRDMRHLCGHVRDCTSVMGVVAVMKQQYAAEAKDEE